MEQPPPRFTKALALVLLLPATLCWAWLGKGHIRATRLAIDACGEDLPDFFARKADWAAHASIDPDAHRNRALAHLRDAEYAQHYFAMELVGDLELPIGRNAYLALLAEKDIDPQKAGLAPYRLAEAVEQLTYALAEYRRRPQSPILQAKCLLLAGWMAHYAQDLCQPLHTTVHFDGRVDAQGNSPRSGIHLKTDALIEKAPVKDEALLGKIQPRPLEDLAKGILEQVRRTHSHVPALYKLEKQISDIQAPLGGGEVSRLANERLAEAAQFTASLYLTAWKNSAGLALPEFHEANRSVTDGPAEASSPAGQGK